MTQYQVTAFFDRPSMEYVLQLVRDEGHFAQVGKTARERFCVVTNSEGSRYLRSLKFRPSTSKTMEFAEEQDTAND